MTEIEELKAKLASLKDRAQKYNKIIKSSEEAISYAKSSFISAVSLSIECNHEIDRIEEQIKKDTENSND